MDRELTTAVPAYIVEAVELVCDAGDGSCDDCAVKRDEED